MSGEATNAAKAELLRWRGMRQARDEALLARQERELQAELLRAAANVEAAGARYEEARTARARGGCSRNRVRNEERARTLFLNAQAQHRRLLHRLKLRSAARQRATGRTQAIESLRVQLRDTIRRQRDLRDDDADDRS